MLRSIRIILILAYGENSLVGLQFYFLPPIVIRMVSLHTPMDSLRTLRDCWKGLVSSWRKWSKFKGRRSNSCSESHLWHSILCQTGSKKSNSYHFEVPFGLPSSYSLFRNNFIWNAQRRSGPPVQFTNSFHSSVFGISINIVWQHQCRV